MTVNQNISFVHFNSVLWWKVVLNHGNVWISCPCGPLLLRSPRHHAPDDLSSQSARSWPPGSHSTAAPAAACSSSFWNLPPASSS